MTARRNPVTVLGAGGLSTAALVALLLTACAAGPVRYPGRADVRQGDRPLIRIEHTNAAETSPRELRVPAGTDVTWLNTTHELVFVRFDQPVREACGTPVRFVRTYDGASYVTSNLAPFNEARLCFPVAGRYDFLVSSAGGGGAGTPPDGDGNGATASVRYGVIVVE